MPKWARYAFFAFAVLFLAWTFVNASWLAPDPAGRTGLIAHRASPPAGRCETAPGTARYPVIPDNSLAAIKAARQLGASMIEIDIAPDGALAPAQCPGSFGANATLAQMADAARPKKLLFTFTGSDPQAADRLAAALQAAGRDPVAAGDAFYGVLDSGPVARIRALMPGAWVFSAQSAASCLGDYRRTGWTGILPEACRGGTMAVPIGAQGMLAGWPNRLLARMKDGGGHVIVVAGEGAQGDLAGLDLPEQFGEIPASFDGLIWVDDLWNLGPALYPRVDNRSRAEQDAGEAAVKARRAAGG